MIALTVLGLCAFSIFGALAAWSMPPTLDYTNGHNLEQFKSRLPRIVDSNVQFPLVIGEEYKTYNARICQEGGRLIPIWDYIGLTQKDFEGFVEKNKLWATGKQKWKDVFEGWGFPPSVRCEIVWHGVVENGAILISTNIDMEVSMALRVKRRLAEPA